MQRHTGKHSEAVRPMKLCNGRMARLLRGWVGPPLGSLARNLSKVQADVCFRSDPRHHRRMQRGHGRLWSGRVAHSVGLSRTSSEGLPQGWEDSNEGTLALHQWELC